MQEAGMHAGGRDISRRQGCMKEAGMQAGGRDASRR